MSKYLLEYPPDEAGKPLMAQAILTTGVLVNILAADVGSSKGTLIISVVGDRKQEQDREDGSGSSHFGTSGSAALKGFVGTPYRIGTQVGLESY